MRRTSELAWRHVGGKFEDRERVSLGLAHDAVGKVRVRRTIHDRGQQAADVVCEKSADMQLRDPGQGSPALGGFAHREDKGDPVRVEPPGDEGEHLGRFDVEPLRVIDEA